MSYKDYPTGFKVKSRHVAWFRDLMSLKGFGPALRATSCTAPDNYF